MINKKEFFLYFFRKPDLKTVFDTDKKPPVASREVKESDSATPMKKIQQNRAKWRDSQKKNLEESWGSLNMFDRHQKGRISMDLDGNIHNKLVLSRTGYYSWQCYFNHNCYFKFGSIIRKKGWATISVFANQLCLSRKFFIDDALDEYLQMPSKKATPNQPSIKEEAEEVEPITTSPGGE